jgi:hypothetical protein
MPPLTVAHNNLLSNLLDLEHLKVAMANSDKINSSLNFNPSTTNSSTTACLRDQTNNNQHLDDVLRQFDTLNITSSSFAFAGTNHAIKNKINSKCKCC